MSQENDSYRLLIENMPDAFARHRLIVDDKGQPVDYEFLYVNSVFEEMTGLSREEIIGKRVTEVLPGIQDSGFDWIGTYGQVALTGKSARFKNYSSPLERWYEITAYSDRSGYFVTIFRDISHMKQEERKIRKSEQEKSLILEKTKKYQKELQEKNYLLESIMNNAPIGIWLVDKEQNPLLVNKYFQDNTGFGTDNPSMTKEEIAMCKKTDDDALAREEPQQYEEVVTFKDGKKHTLQTMKTKIYNDDGSVSGILGLGIDMTKQKQAEEKIRRLSLHDKLTNLYNRHYMEEEMERLDAQNKLPISIIMVDVNGLKLVNDTYGHSVGDEILKRAAGILRSVCGKEDIIARWGGDEFVIILPQTTIEEAQSVGKNIMRQCRKEYVRDIPVSMATGIASKDRTGKELADVLREAEDYMYRHKLTLTESRSVRNAVLNSLLKALAEKSHETEIHTLRMQAYAFKAGAKMNLPDSELNRLSLVITLHDIGKINIPEEVLTKEGPLHLEEWEIMKKHPDTGYRITKATEEFGYAAEDILAHHERWDGSGYPRGQNEK